MLPSLADTDHLVGTRVLVGNTRLVHYGYEGPQVADSYAKRAHGAKSQPRSNPIFQAPIPLPLLGRLYFGITLSLFPTCGLVHKTDQAGSRP